MNTVNRISTLALSVAVALAINAPAFADADYAYGHNASSASKGYETLHLSMAPGEPGVNAAATMAPSSPDGAKTLDAGHTGHAGSDEKTGDNAIEIYGKLYMSLGYSDPGSGAPDVLDLSSHGSYLGVRGNQPLNAALHLFWQIESGIDLDNLGEGGHDGGGNTSSFGGRDTFIGLSGNAGTVLFGKHFTPLTMVLHANDPFAHIPGDARSMLGYVGHHYESKLDSGHGTIFYVRAPNSIVYLSPEVGGFSANVALIAIDESMHDGVRLPGTSLSLNFKRGDFNIAYAFERHHGLDVKTSHSLPDPDVLDRTQVHLLSAMYHFPTTMVNVAVQRLDVKDSVDGNHDRMAYHVSVQQMFGPHSLRAAYAQATDFGNHSSGDSDGGQIITVGWFQALSSTTEAYVAVAATNNEKRGDFGTFFVDDVSRGDDPTSLATGLIHNF